MTQARRRVFHVQMAHGRTRIATLGAALAAALLGAAPATGATWGVTTVAGNGNSGFTGDGVLATATMLNGPPAVAAAADGSFLIADFSNHRVRRVTPDGLISTVAGNGQGGTTGDGGPATSAAVNTPRGVAFEPDGGFLIADRDMDVVRRVAPDGRISTVAGTGARGYTGDGGAATAATLDQPYGAAPTPDGGFLIADRGNNVIRKVASNGRITTVAGTGVAGFGGDNGPATAAPLNAPCAVAVAPDGSFVVPDRDNDRVRRVDTSGTITTIVGNGQRASTGDGGPATAAATAGPYAVAFAPDGALIVVERDGELVRRVAADGTIETIAGTGAAGFGGDGGAALAAQLNGPVGAAVAADGSILIADSNNHRIRRLTPGFVAAPVAPVTPATAVTPSASTSPARAGPARLTLRARSLRVHGRHRGRLRFVASAPAAVRVEILRGRRRVALRRVRARTGTNTALLPRLRAGRYRVRLTAPGAAASAALVVTRR